MELPAVSPETMPLLLTDATAPEILLQFPPGVASVSAVVSPIQTDSVPAIDAGSGLTTTDAVLKQPVAGMV